MSTVTVDSDALAAVVLATLPAVRCIADGNHYAGCVVYDGAITRERLRTAVLALKSSATPTPEETT